MQHQKSQEPANEKPVLGESTNEIASYNNVPPSPRTCHEQQNYHY